MAKTVVIDGAILSLVLLFCWSSPSTGQTHPTYSCDSRPGQADTTEKLQQLRARLTTNNLFAYVIFSEDEHQSEYVQRYDERRAWITGFTGSAGTAVVTRDRAALWTDGRYWTQAEDQLDCRSWYLMRQGRVGIPSITTWLLEEIENTTLPRRVGVAAQFVSSGWWSAVNNGLTAKNATLTEVSELIDLIWRAPERPAAPSNPIIVHHLNYTGMPWQDKVQKIASMIRARKADAYIVTTLDDVAWLFSVRGSDIPYNPFFKVYQYSLISSCCYSMMFFFLIGLCDCLCRWHSRALDESKPVNIRSDCSVEFGCYPSLSIVSLRSDWHCSK